jgi:hypothetical protein
MALTHPVPTIATDPGYLLYAPLGTAEPTHAVTASVFSDDWTAVSGWIVLGDTEEGHNFDWSISTENVESAEHLDPLRIVSTGREGKVSFALVSIHSNNLKRALNGGTLTTTGSTTTTMTTYTPPALGQEVRCMLGWESEDHTERYVWYQCLQSGSVSIARKKGANKATLPVEFSLEVPASGNPFKHISAGVARLGA